MKSNEDDNKTAQAVGGAGGVTTDRETLRDEGCAYPRPGGLSTSNDAGAVTSEGAASDALTTAQGTPAATDSTAMEGRLPRTPAGRPAGMATPRARRNRRAGAGFVGRSDDSDAKGDKAAAGVASRVPGWAATHTAAPEPPPPPRSSNSTEMGIASNAGCPTVDDGSGMEPPLPSDTARRLARLPAAPSGGVSEPDAFVVEGTDSDGGGGAQLENMLGAGDIAMTAIFAAAESKAQDGAGAAAAAVPGGNDDSGTRSNHGLDPSEKYNQVDVEHDSDSRAAADSGAAVQPPVLIPPPALAPAVGGQDPTPGAYIVHRRAPGLRPPRPRTRRRSPRRNNRSVAQFITSFGRSSRSAASSGNANGGGGASAVAESSEPVDGFHDASLLQATAVTDAEPIVYAESVTKDGDESYRVLLKKRKVRNALAVAMVVLLGLIALAVCLVVTIRRKGDEEQGEQQGTPNDPKSNLCSRLKEDSRLYQCHCASNSYEDSSESSDSSDDIDIALPKDYAVVSDLILNHTMTTEDEVDEASCSHRNMALLWLSEDTITQNELSAAAEDNNSVAINKIVQRYVLALLYFTWGGDKWESQFNDGWLSDKDECGNWANLECHQNVTRLQFQHIGLDGTIPKEMGHLSNLEFLDLSNNNITGTIPTEILGNGKLGKLLFLDLSRNEITGFIPNHISRNGMLRVAIFANNFLRGPLPHAIANMPHLILLALDGNQLTGTIPSEVGQLTGLKILELGGNNLKGTLPYHFENMTKLERLNMGGNDFSGPIPSEYGLLEDLEELALANNALTGTIPKGLGELSGLEFLDLRNNSFHESALPANFCDTMFFLNIIVDCEGDEPKPGFNQSCCRCTNDLSYNGGNSFLKDKCGLLE